jgi:hypothetical protein
MAKRRFVAGRMPAKLSCAVRQGAAWALEEPGRPCRGPNARNVMSRRTQSVLLVAGWIFSIVLFVFMYVTYNGTKLSYSEKFPGMPLYGAMTWWFFFTIPVIGFTWGYFNDLKNRG